LKLLCDGTKAGPRKFLAKNLIGQIRLPLSVDRLTMVIKYGIISDGFEGRSDFLIKKEFIFQ
jgi:hypothetical protein